MKSAQTIGEALTMPGRLADQPGVHQYAPVARVRFRQFALDDGQLC